MARTDTQRLKSHAAIFKALAHPSRLRIIEALADGELCVRDLRGLVGSDLSTVSRHLAVLRNVGLIGDDKRGLQVFYRITCKCLLDFLECVVSAEKARADSSRGCGRGAAAPRRPAKRRTSN
jgi:ArsR family transcriptional regulator